MNSKKLLTIAALILFAVISRLIPHPFNFTAIGALALFCGSVFTNKKLAFVVPALAMLATDAMIGFHASMIPVYLCFSFAVLIGIKMIKEINLITVPTASIISSIVFFLVTNLPFWYADMSLYPLSWQGTMESYTAALPFFANQMAGDLFYSATFFGAYVVLRQKYFAPANS
ncbi:MAG: hypothetical protein NTV09_09925 [Bacteroidetes bacterium]|nr:hypothetical protein [Bacteroidota bacterium]